MVSEAAAKLSSFLGKIKRYPNMFFLGGSYLSACNFLVGMDYMSERPFLSGFDGWLRCKLGSKSTRHWAYIIEQYANENKMNSYSEKIDFLLEMVEEYIDSPHE
ncbi:hypothetical protein [Halovulum sp. GXIMD14793]